MGSAWKAVMKDHLQIHKVTWDFPLYVGAFEVWVGVESFKVGAHISSALFDLIELIGLVFEGLDYDKEEKD